MTTTTNAPKAGDVITYRGKATGTVIGIQGNLCWMSFFDGSDPAPFIWKFKDGLNNLHNWPSKNCN